ncbi:hypothetical protein EJ06DRAFT_203850 [Trichodelitschia bisporula]|uniref:Uncharacterized protein n=1 Tax=Trichodelitschia bisporula TaxID=703511 RepID=A0A6G1I8U9_9PEZI|nr:hypothetical protein EJ06DRAFT_203850 [Trichodelitschia bisporula]
MSDRQVGQHVMRWGHPTTKHSAPPSLALEPGAGNVPNTMWKPYRSPDLAPLKLFPRPGIINNPTGITAAGWGLAGPVSRRTSAPRAALCRQRSECAQLYRWRGLRSPGTLLVRQIECRWGHGEWTPEWVIGRVREDIWVKCGCLGWLICAWWRCARGLRCGGGNKEERPRFVWGWIRRRSLACRPLSVALCWEG